MDTVIIYNYQQLTRASSSQLSRRSSDSCRRVPLRWFAWGPTEGDRRWSQWAVRPSTSGREGEPRSTPRRSLASATTWALHTSSCRTKSYRQSHARHHPFSSIHDFIIINHYHACSILTRCDVTYNWCLWWATLAQMSPKLKTKQNFITIS